MTLKTNLKILLPILFLLILILVYSQHQKKLHEKGNQATLFQIEEVTKLGLQHDNIYVSLEKKNKLWEITSYQGNSPLDRRANQGMTEHVLDLLRNIKSASENKLDAHIAPEYGIKNPELVLSYAWNDQGEEKQDVVFLGNRDLKGNQVFAFFPKTVRHDEVFIKIPSLILDFFSQKGLYEIRDTRISTLEADDVEEIRFSGPKCNSFHLLRNGDEWISTTKRQKEKRISNMKQIHDLLSLVVNTKADEVIDEKPIPLDSSSKKAQCHIEIQAIREKKETIVFYAYEKSSIAINSNLPSKYKIDESHLFWKNAGFQNFIKNF